MQTITQKFKSSMAELTRPQGIAIAAMLLAVRVVLGYFSNLTLNFSPSIKFSFSFLPIALCGALLGPSVAGIVGAFGDIFSYILNPAGGAYFPGWTLNAMLGGIIYGLLLYKAQTTPLKLLLRIIIAKVLITVFVELLLGTFWLYVQFGMPYLVTLSGRAIKQLIFTPLEIAIIFAFLKAPALAKVIRKQR